MTDTRGKRIAKNTVMMYIRMFVTLAVSLYTSRIVLQALGVTDFGIYNVVGGIVTFFTFLNGAMMAATQRFLNFEIGHGDKQALNTVFKTGYIIHLILAVFIVLVGCTLGKYLLDTKIQIPPDKLFSATIVLYVSCFTCGLQILTLPFSSDVIAHERINVFAWVSILESILKLLIAFWLRLSTNNRLVEYAVLIGGVQLVSIVIYIFYCRRNFPEVRGHFVFNRVKFREMGNFAAWCIIGSMAGAFANQGISILLGVFFLPAINAARGIAVQVQAAVSTFGSNLNTAMAPQITQSYAAGDFPFFYNILYRGSKYIFYLMALIAIPILLRTDYIVQLWLGEVPAYTVQFIRWLLFTTLIETISYPLMRASDASGRIKLYHSVVGGILLMILPTAYFALKLTDNPVSVFQLFFIINLIAWAARLIILRKTVMLSVRKYIYKVVLRIIAVFILAILGSYYATEFIPNGLLGLIGVCVICSIITLSLTYILGLDRSERKFVFDRFQTLRKRL